MAERKSNFSVTCSLLSQFIKRNGSVGELGMLDIVSRPQEPSKDLFRTPTTLNLLPGVDVSADKQTDTDVNVSVSDRSAEKSSRETENSQLTIFYGGKVMVFDHFSSEKFTDLVNLASKSSNISSTKNTIKLNTSDIQMPKASLHRFLEKRRNRILAKAPYQVNESKAKHEEDAQTRLGLGSEFQN